VQLFKDKSEFKRVFEHIFALMNEHPEVGRPLRDAHAPHRFLITDLGLELNVTAADNREGQHGRFLKWVWGPADWKPVITLEMSSATANSFFQGKENVALAMVLGRVKASGPLGTLLRLAPVTNAIHPVYRQWLEKTGRDHLLV
jgi:SCP-2 sterol transfer family